VFEGDRAKVAHREILASE